MSLPTPNTEQLAALVAAKQHVLEILVQLSRRQVGLIESGDMTLLMKVLAGKQTVMSQLQTIERELALRGARVGSRGRFKSLLRMSDDWRTQVFVLKWMFLPSPQYLYSMHQLHSPWQLPFYYLSRPLRYVARRTWWYCKSRLQRPAKRGNLLTA